MSPVLQTALEALEKLAKGQEKVVAEKLVDAFIAAVEKAIPGDKENLLLEAQRAAAVEALVKLADPLVDKIDGKVG